MSPTFDPGQDDEPTCGVCGSEMLLGKTGNGHVYFCGHCSDAAEEYQSFIDHERNLDLLEKD